MIYEYHPTYYVGIKETEFSKETFPLGFATPFTDDAPFEKRKITLENWCNNYGRSNPNHAVMMLDNVPVSGFKLDKAVSRSSTDNKWFQIQDPRGFSLQISSYNLTDILLDYSIVEGELIGKYAWVRTKQTNYLINELDREFVPVLDTSPIQIGDIIQTTAMDRVVYLGLYDSYRVEWYEARLYEGVAYTGVKQMPGYVAPQYHNRHWEQTEFDKMFEKLPGGFSLTPENKDIKYHTFWNPDTNNFTSMKTLPKKYVKVGTNDLSRLPNRYGGLIEMDYHGKAPACYYIKTGEEFDIPFSEIALADAKEFFPDHWGFRQNLFDCHPESHYYKLHYNPETTMNFYEINGKIHLTSDWNRNKLNK